MKLSSLVTYATPIAKFLEQLGNRPFKGPALDAARQQFSEFLSPKVSPHLAKCDKTQYNYTLSYNRFLNHQITEQETCHLKLTANEPPTVIDPRWESITGPALQAANLKTTAEGRGYIVLRTNTLLPLDILLNLQPHHIHIDKRTKFICIKLPACTNFRNGHINIIRHGALALLHLKDQCLEKGQKYLFETNRRRMTAPELEKIRKAWPSNPIDAAWRDEDLRNYASFQLVRRTKCNVSTLAYRRRDTDRTRAKLLHAAALATGPAEDHDWLDQIDSSDPQCPACGVPLGTLQGNHCIACGKPLPTKALTPHERDLANFRRITNLLTKVTGNNDAVRAIQAAATLKQRNPEPNEEQT